MTKYDETLFEEKPYDEELFEDVQYEESEIAPEFDENLTSTGQESLATKKGSEDNETSALEAFGLGTASMTGPIIGGAAAVAGEQFGKIGQPKASLENLPLSPEVKQKVKSDPALLKETEDVIQKVKDTESMKDTFYEGRDYTKDRQAKAFDEHPIANTAGMITEGIATGGFLGAAGKAKKAADIAKLSKKMQIFSKLKTGAKVGGQYGALHGLLTGEAKLAEGEIGEMALESLLGAGTGAITGVALSGVGQAGMGALKSKPIQGVSNKIQNISNGSLKSTKTFLNSMKKKLGTTHLGKSHKIGKEGLILDDRYQKIFGNKLSKAFLEDIDKLIKQNNLNRKEVYKILDINVGNLKRPDFILETADRIGQEGTGGRFTKMIMKNLGKSKEVLKAEAKALRGVESAKLKAEKAGEKLTSKALGRAAKTGEVPDELITGNIKPKDIRLDTEYPNVQRKVQYSKFQPKADETGALTEGKTLVDSIDITQPEFNKLPLKEKLTPKEIGNMMKELRDFINPQATNQEDIFISREAMKLKDKLATYLDDTVQGVFKKNPELKQQSLLDVNKQFNRIDNLSKKFGFKRIPGLEYASKGKRDLSDIISQRKLFADKFKDVSQGKSPISDLDVITQNLKEVDEGLYNKFKPEIQKYQTLIELLNKHKSSDSGSGMIFKPIINKIKNNSDKIANKIGRMANKSTKDAANVAKGKIKVKVGGIEKITSSTDGIKKLINKIDKLGADGQFGQFREVLNKASTAPKRTRDAILFSLMGNPEFKKLLDKEKE